MASSSVSKAAGRRLLAAAIFFAALIGSGNVAGASKLGPVPIASAGRSQTSIVIGDSAGQLNKYAASELQKYMRLLTGVELPIIASAEVSSRPAKDSLILVGGPAVSSVVRESAEAKWVNFSGLKPEGFVVKTGGFKGHPAVVLGGNDDVSGSYIPLIPSTVKYK
jgi:hypothetical protein